MEEVDPQGDETKPLEIANPDVADVNGAKALMQQLFAELDSSRDAGTDETRRIRDAKSHVRSRKRRRIPAKGDRVKDEIGLLFPRM